MQKKIISLIVMMLLITLISTNGHSSPYENIQPTKETIIIQEQRDGFDFGDAPEGPSAIAYPSSGILGSFPTCMSTGPASWIKHNNFGAYFGPTFDFEPDGNGGMCPTGSYPPYDQDECFMDNDAGLIIPDPYTINNAGTVVPCPAGAGIPLGIIGQTAVWGVDVDIDVHNHMPSATTGYVNVLIDWNQNGMWGDPGEHVLVNFPVPNPFDGPLSNLQPPSFTIGQNPGYVWARFSITETQVNTNWIGDGDFEDGETEDYLLKITQAQNNPPLTPSQPSGPTTGFVGITYTYTTSTTDPDNDNIRYGWDANADNIVDAWTGYYASGATCAVNIVFNNAGTYTLQVLAEDIHGLQSTYSPSLTVTISQGANNPPNTPNTPTGPTTGIASVSYSYSTSTNDPDGDNVKYGWDWNGDGTVDQWDDNGGSYYASGTSITTAHTFTSSGTYLVQVKAEDVNGAQSGFSQPLTVVIRTNTAPTTPIVTGPSRGKVGTAYTFSATSTDPEGDQIYYWFDWGDGTNSGWIGPYMSGVTANTAHTWTSKATYTVQVKAKDDPAGLESGWGTASISVPNSKQLTPLGTIIIFGMDVEILNKNNGEIDLKVMNKPLYIWGNELLTINPGVFIKLYQAKGMYSPLLPLCVGCCTDWAITG